MTRRVGRAALLAIVLAHPAAAQPRDADVAAALAMLAAAQARGAQLLTVGPYPGDDAPGTGVPRFTGYGVRIGHGTLSVNNPDAYGFYDTAVAASVTAGGLEPHAGFLGGFEAGVPAIAGYGSLDRGAFFAGVGDKGAAFEITGVTIGPVRITPGTRLTAGQVAYLRPHMLLTTNNAPARGTGWATYVTAVDPAGGWIDTVGWAEMGGGVATIGQVPSGPLPPSVPQTILVNPATALFGGNIVATLQPGGAARTAIGLEVDIVNARAFDPASQAPLSVGVSLQSLGAFRGGSALHVGGNWQTGLNLSAGVAGQAILIGGGGSYGLFSSMTAGYPLVHQLSGTTRFYVDHLGNMGVNAIILSSCPPSPKGLPPGALWCDGTVVHRAP